MDEKNNLHFCFTKEASGRAAAAAPSLAEVANGCVLLGAKLAVGVSLT